jgi:surface carbohydrate biosynthesis protein
MIIIWADSRWRDAFGLALLSHELDKQGLDNLVVDFQLAPHVMEAIGEHVSGVVLNHTIGKRNKAIIRQTKRVGGSVFVLPTEGKPTPENQQWFLENQVGYDHLFTWTPEFLPPKSTVTGSPRFQIYTDYRQFIDSRMTVLDKYRIPRDKKNIVFVSAYPQAKFTRKNSRFNRADWADLGRDGADENAKQSAFDLSEFGRYIYNFVDDDTNIILRPHPMEDLLWWERFQGRLLVETGHQSYLISQEYVANLLSIADTWVVKKNCTTILDRSLYGGESELLVFDGDGYDGDWASDVRSTLDSAKEIAHIMASMTRMKPLPVDKYLQITHYLKAHNNVIFPSPDDTHVGKQVPMSIISGWKRKLAQLGGA